MSSGAATRALLVAAGLVCAPVSVASGWGETSRGVEGDTGDVVYVGDVERIVRKHCATCHLEGGSAPFALTSFVQARAWSRSIAREVERGRMPPWHADPDVGRFANERRLPADDRARLLRWVESGARRGEGAELPAPPAVDTEGWSIGEPDLVLELPEIVTVPADGDVPYHSYRVPVPLENDAWVQAAEVRPGNLEVVHHVIVEISGGRPRPGDDPRTSGSLGGFVPGDGPLIMPPGTARRLPAGSEILFQMHYTPTGEVEHDLTALGLVLADGPPEYETRTGLVSTPFLWIPAGERDVEVTAEWTFPRDSMLLSLRPHMHRRGSSFEFSAHYPNGERESLLRVSSYDFSWQTTYVLAVEKVMPAGTVLHARAIYDNSPENPHNPDPSQDVSWGEQTSDEMMIGFFDYYEVNDRGQGEVDRTE